MKLNQHDKFQIIHWNIFFFFNHPAVKTNWNGRIMMCKVLQNNAMDFAAAAARNNLYQKNICWVPFAITGSWDQCTVNYSPHSISPLLYFSDAAYQFVLLCTGSCYNICTVSMLALTFINKALKNNREKSIYFQFPPRALAPYIYLKGD